MPVYEIPMADGTALDVPCPFLFVPLLVQAVGGVEEFGFVLDTGAAVSLFPVPYADRYRVPYDPRAVAGDAAPKTLLGRLTGHPGELRVRLGESPFVLPCFFYYPAPSAAKPPAATLDEWEDRLAGTPRRQRHRCVLGRLGFLNRVDLLVRRTEFLVAAGADRVPVPSRPKPARLDPPRRR